MNRYFDLINVSIATVAVGLSLMTVLKSGRQERRQSMFRVHETLLTEDLIAGRRTLYRSRDVGLPIEPDRLSQAERAIYTLNAVGALIRQGVVPRTWFVDAWHSSLRDLRVGVDLVREQRLQEGARIGWPDLEQLIREGETWRCNKECCHPAVPAAQLPSPSASSGAAAN
jgi:hypothetical protein